MTTTLIPIGRRGFSTQLIWPLVALLAILLYNAISTPNFFQVTLQNDRLTGSLVDIPKNAAPVMLVAMGMTLVLATGGVDLSVGAVMAISGALAALLLQQGMPLWGVLGISLLVSLAAGLWNGLLVAIVNLQPIVATLILMVAGRGAAQLLSDGQKTQIASKSFEFIGRESLLGLPFMIHLAVAVFLLTALMTRRTALGLFIEAVGNNATASRYAGVNATLVKLSVYAFSGLCAGLAGLVLTSNLMESDPSNTGLYLELDAILAAVIGGTALSGGRFSLAGAMIGALIIQSLTTTILAQGIKAEATLVVKSVVVLAICLLQSEVLRRKLFRKRKATA